LRHAGFSTNVLISATAKTSRQNVIAVGSMVLTDSFETITLPDHSNIAMKGNRKYGVDMAERLAKLEN
jgi:hypothetical protein